MRCGLHIWGQCSHHPSGRGRVRRGKDGPIVDIREEGPSCEGTGCVAVNHDDRVTCGSGGPRVVDEDTRLVDGLKGVHLVTFIDKLPVVRDRDANRCGGVGTIGRHDRCW